MATETNLNTLQFEVVRTDLDIEEGRLVRANIGNKPVIYQVINGIIKEEILYQKNTYGYARAHAKKIGIWNETKARFDTVGWIPRLNQPVYLMQRRHAEPKAEAVGFFPGTDYPVSLDIDLLVNHNCEAGIRYLMVSVDSRLCGSDKQQNILFILDALNYNIAKNQFLSRLLSQDQNFLRIASRNG